MSLATISRTKSRNAVRCRQPRSFLCFSGITEQVTDFGWPVVAGIDFDQNAAAPTIQSFLASRTAAPDDIDTNFSEGAFDEFAHGMGFPGC